MHVMTGVALAAVLGLGFSGLQAEQQGKEVSVANSVPRLADVLKGYVGQDCWVQWSSSGSYTLSFSPSEHHDPANGWQEKKVKLVGQDFISFSGEHIVPLAYVSCIFGKKP